MNRWMGKDEDLYRDLEGPLAVSLRLDADGNADVRAVAASRAAAKEAMRRLKMWVDEGSWVLEALLERAIGQTQGIKKAPSSNFCKRTNTTSSAKSAKNDEMFVDILLAPDASAVVATHPEHVVEAKRRLRKWADYASAEPEIEIPEDELRCLEARELVDDWYPGMDDYLGVN